MVQLFGGLPPVASSNLAERVRTQQSLGDLASGKKVTGAADDPAVLALSVDLDAELSGLRQASRNTFEAIAVAQTADGGMQGINQALTKLKELAVQASSSTLSPEAKGAVEAEFNKTLDTLDQLAASTEFNGIQLLDGSAATLNFQVGTGATAGDAISLVTTDVSSAALGLGAVSVATSTDAQAAIDAIDAASADVANAQASVGATTNQLLGAADNLQTAIVNTSAGLSTAVDTDFGGASTDLTTSLLLQQTQISVQVQANAQQATVLKLLG